MIYGYLLVRISCQLEVANFGDGLLEGLSLYRSTYQQRRVNRSGPYIPDQP